MTQQRVTLVSMSGLRVGHQALLDVGMRLPGLVRRADALGQLPPLGLLTIASLIPERWEVSLVLDDGVQDITHAKNRIMETNPTLVAFSALTPSIDRAASISQLLRNHGVQTVVGGLHATADREYCQPHFDSVVCGDGEPVITGLLADAERGNLKAVYRSRDIFDLAHSPRPRWDLLDQYRPPRYTMQTMRGCPWNCSFCAASRLLGPARTKPLDLIENELAAIQARQSRPWLELADDNTFAVQRDHDRMLDALKASGARWFTESDWRIARHPQLLNRIASSGCRQILIGFESQIFRYPGMGGKTAQWQSMLEAAQAIQEAGIVVNACFIVGADGESPASIERLGDFLEQAPFGEIQLTLQTPFPGTSLHQTLKHEGRLIYDDYARYTLFDVVYQPSGMSPAALQDRFDALIERVFSTHNQQRRDQIQKTIRKRRKSAERESRPSGAY